MRMAGSRALCVALVILGSAWNASGHGVMCDPPARGSMGNKHCHAGSEVPRGYKKDTWAHFPSGDKSRAPGAGQRSQKWQAGGMWTVYEPERPGFWPRAGPCGDMVGTGEHLKGGAYYNDAMISATYTAGSYVNFKFSVTQPHKGYLEFRLCDVSKCRNGDMSYECFQQGRCVTLERAPNPECDNGNSPVCGPIDRQYPTRWYFPCVTEKSQVFGQGNTMLYKIPDGFYSEHAVIQTYWLPAANCNPPGVIEYFRSPDAPKNWGHCSGSANKMAFKDNMAGCEKNRAFPEEYYYCSDVKVLPGSPVEGGRSMPRTSEAAAPTPTNDNNNGHGAQGFVTGIPQPDTPASYPEPPANVHAAIPSSISRSTSSTCQHSSTIASLIFHADGRPIRTLSSTDRIDVTPYTKFTVEARTSQAVRSVTFTLNGNPIRTEGSQPYVVSGDSGNELRHWKDAPLNQEFVLRASSGGGGSECLETRLTLVKQ